MTEEQISQWARESNMSTPLYDYQKDQLQAFATIVRNATLEEAALACKAYGEIPRMDSGVPNALAYQIKSMKS